MKVFIPTLLVFFSLFAHAATLNILSTEEKEYISNRDEVRIAIFEETNSDTSTSPMIGEFYTLNLNYLKRVANHVGLKLKFVEYGQGDEIKKALEQQEVDLAVGFQYKDLDAKPLLYSKPFIESSVAYWTKSEQNELWDQRYRWVCVKGSIYCGILEKQGASNVSQTETFDEAVKSVLHNERDAVLASYISLSEYLNHSDELTGTLYTPDWGGLVTAQIMANKQQYQLVKIINKIIDFIDQEAYIFTKSNPYHVTDMANIAFKLQYDTQEQIRYSFSDDAFPLLFRNSKGELTGYLYDLLALIESRTGLKFQYVELNEDKSLLEMLTLGEIDLIPYSPNVVNSLEAVDFTDTLISFRYYAVSLVDKPSQVEPLDGVLLAQSKEELGLKDQIFGVNSNLYSSPKEILKALEAGKIRRAYIREDIVDMIISSHADDDYFIDRKEFKTVNAVMAVSASKPILTNLLNSVVRTWDGNELQKIKNSYDPFNVVYGFDYRLLFQLLFGFAGLIAIAGIVIYLWLKNLNLKVIIKENDVRNSRLENHFLQSVIQQFPSQVFIHNEEDELLLSSCDKYLKGDCGQCALRDSNQVCTLLLTKEERCHVRTNDEYIKRIIDVPGDYTRTIEYVCKRVTANSKSYVLTIIDDITAKQLQERELVAAKQKAEQAISIRDKFLASMSHELRTPIAGMTGLLEMLMDRITDEEGRMLLSNISASARQLNVLVNDILDFSKLDAQQLKLEHRECAILRETGEVLRIHLAAAQEKGLELKYHFSPTNVDVIAFDSLRYAQIVNNLVSNAIKFTDEGKVQVQVTVDETTIRLCVLDSGCGMSKQQQSMVFSPFVQADNTIARKYGGTGLGLSIVSELTDLMGGKIALSSIQGLGTKVEVELPHELVSHYVNGLGMLSIDSKSQCSEVASWINIWTSNHEPDEAADTVLIRDERNVEADDEYDYTVKLDRHLSGFKRTEGNIVTLSSSPFFPDLLLDTLLSLKNTVGTPQIVDSVLFSGQVLVAEDNPINQLVIRKQLNSIGLQAELVANGSEAFERLKQRPQHYDLLITDCHMPVLDGFELVRKVRTELPECDSLGIIGCTAEDSRTARDTAELVGFDRMLYKPYGIENLRIAVSDMLSTAVNEESSCGCWLDKFDEQEAVQMKQVFVSSMQDDMSTLKSEDIDSASLKKIAHKVKGGASILGIGALAQQARQIEHKAEHASDQQVPELANKLVKSIENQILLAERCQRGS
ncbi:hypothetical protein AKJ18_10780 [Vibrio xuii]|nr:hypothetical protein AKJ18_10780 [Vibrio xuii]